MSTGIGAELEDTVGVGTATGSPRSFMNIVLAPNQWCWDSSALEIEYGFGIRDVDASEGGRGKGRLKVSGFLVARHKVGPILNSPEICLKTS